MAEPGYDENGDPLVKGPVASVGVAVHATTTGNWDLAERMEKAMSEEVQRSYDEGVTDPDRVRERIHAVRDKMLNETA